MPARRRRTVAQFPRELEFNANVNFATVHPGDTLVVALNLKRPLTEQEAEDIRERLQGALPGVRVSLS